MALPGREFYESYTTPGSYTINVGGEEVEVSFVCAGGGGGGGGNDSQMGRKGGKGAQISGKFIAPANATIQIYVGAGGPGATWENPWGPGGTNGYGLGNGGDGGYGHMSGGGASGGAASIIVVNGSVIAVAGGGAGGGGGGQYSGGYGNDMDAKITNSALNILDGGDGGSVGMDSGGGGAGGGGSPGGSGGPAAGWDQDQGGGSGTGGSSHWSASITDFSIVLANNDGASGTNNDNNDPGNQIRNAGDGFITINYAFPGTNSDITISLGDLQTEFGGSNPISISEYYRGGSYVPNTSINDQVPTSGTISLSDFFGASLINLPGNADITVHPDGNTIWTYSTSSDFTINVPGDVSILMLGGGGSGSSGYAGMGNGQNAGGLVYFGTHYLDVGEYTATVGGSNEETKLIRNGSDVYVATNGHNAQNQNSDYGYGFGNGPGSGAGILHGAMGAAGGGGAGGSGGNGSVANGWGIGGNGANGLVYDISGTNITYGGGGGGSGSYSNNVNSATVGGTGGTGGGGRGYARGRYGCTSGTDGLGGGAGGGSGVCRGGSGIIIMKGECLSAI
jgi:hypothetical protein